MAITNTSPEQHPEFYLRLFKEEMARKLIDEAIAHIRPHIAQAAVEAVNSIEARIIAEHDVMTDRLLVQFVGKVEHTK